MKIIVAVDGSAHSVKACRWAAALTRSLKEKPSLSLIAVDEPLSNSVAVKMGPTASAKYHKENADYALGKARTLLARARVTWDEEVRIGHPAKEITDLAEREKADIIVMGSHGRTAFKSLVLGSVSAKVIATTSIPVVIIR